MTDIKEQIFSAIRLTALFTFMCIAGLCAAIMALGAFMMPLVPFMLLYLIFS